MNNDYVVQCLIIINASAWKFTQQQPIIQQPSKPEVADGQVVRPGISVTWNVLSWSRGHEFEPRSGHIWDA